jgi:hypothetical protein
VNKRRQMPMVCAPALPAGSAGASHFPAPEFGVFDSSVFSPDPYCSTAS